MGTTGMVIIITKSTNKIKISICYIQNVFSFRVTNVPQWLPPPPKKKKRFKLYLVFEGLKEEYDAIIWPCLCLSPFPCVCLLIIVSCFLSSLISLPMFHQPFKALLFYSSSCAFWTIIIIKMKTVFSKNLSASGSSI